MMRSQRRPLVTDPTFTLDRIVAGEFDGDLSAWADAARSFGTALVVENGTEVNGDWNPWSAPYNGGLDVGPGKFKAAYRHIVGVMRGRGATNITWSLHYNAENYPGDDPRNVPAAYYPGDDVVDWVGISAYGSERSNDHRCPTFRSLVEDMLPQLRVATASKPLFIFEFGITNNNSGCEAGPWVVSALGDLLGGRWPDVRGFAWWNERWNNDGAEGSDMLVQDDPRGYDGVVRCVRALRASRPGNTRAALADGAVGGQRPLSPRAQPDVSRGAHGRLRSGTAARIDGPAGVRGAPFRRIPPLHRRLRGADAAQAIRVRVRAILPASEALVAARRAAVGPAARAGLRRRTHGTGGGKHLQPGQPGGAAVRSTSGAVGIKP